MHQIDRSIFINNVLDFRQIFGSDKYMRPYLRLTTTNEQGELEYVYPYDLCGNPVFPVCPIRTVNMSDNDKYKPCPYHKFYGDDHYTIAVDSEGDPIFPRNTNGEPVVPLTKCGSKYSIYFVGF